MNKEIVDQCALENICRTCLFEAETLVHISSEIESKTSENITVASILTDVFQLEVILIVFTFICYILIFFTIFITYVL